MKHWLMYGIGCLLSFTASAQNVLPYLDDKLPIETRVKDALSRMTTEEKVKLCHAQSKFSSPGVPRLGIPEIWMSDGPHGVRMEIEWNSWNWAGWTNDSCTAFPSLSCLAATWNPEMAAIFGKAIGEEARYRKKDVILGPDGNIHRTPLGGRNFEYMGEDPHLTSQLVVPYIKGVQQNGVAACIKHYLLNDQETYRGHINVEVNERALNEIYLPPFKAAVEKGGVWTIMGAYNQYKNQHCCHNDTLLNKILKEQWKFDGCVITDWGGAHDTYQAAMNGLDIEMGSYTNGLTTESQFTYDDYYLANPYLKMLKEGKVPMSTLDDKASRILRLIFRTSMNRNRPWGVFGGKEHLNVADKIATEGIVLLKNNKNGKAPLLPLQADSYKTILVVGDNAIRSLTEGGGSSELKPHIEISPLQGLQEKYGDKIVYAQGYKAGKPMYGAVEEIPQEVQDSLRREAVEMAKKADLVIYVGGLNKNDHQDCEGNDRLSYGLPFSQDKLIEELVKVNPKMVMVLLTGNAVAMPWEKQISSILYSWYPGSASGRALAEILSGDVTPSGKLPMSIPFELQDVPAHHFGTISYPGDSINEVYKEGIFVGYRWYDTKKIPVRFPFGHGISYTTFQYGTPQLSSPILNQDKTITVSLEVKNTGKVKGKEIVQLYIGSQNPLVERPLKELKHFKKIEILPGEKSMVSFTITPEDLAYFNDKTHSWQTDNGKYTIYIGSSSKDIRTSKIIEFK